MYYSHFGLSQAPFKITPNTEFFFSGGNRGPILEALIYAITHGEGVIKVTGEVGSGKTMLCHMLPKRLPPHVETVYIANPSVSPEEILHTIAFELQLAVDRGASRLAVMQALHDYLLKRYAEGKRVVVFVEESQSMPLATLEEIRLLSNLEAKNDKLLQIVLFGQPELDDNLRQPQTRPLRERVTHSFRLEPLAAGEIREYLMFRMRAAGYRGPDLFTSSVIGSIARASLGLTRRVNLIADKALLAAFSENTHTVRPKHVDAAVRDSEFSRQPHSHAQPRYWWGAALVAGGAALGIGVYALLQRVTEHPAAATSATQPAPAGVRESALPPKKATHPPLTPAAPQAKAALAPTPMTPSVAAGASAATLQAQELRGGGPDDLVETRIAETRKWLASEAHSTYSIQLFGTNDPQLLKTHLNDLAKSIEINKVFVYRTLAKQKPSLTVLYGSFGDRRAAQQALDQLPESLKANQPILRTVNGIRTEIKQHEAS
jgi:type II secretory pathway predicted ATPase ExeA